MEKSAEMGPELIVVPEEKGKEKKQLESNLEKMVGEQLGAPSVPGERRTSRDKDYMMHPQSSLWSPKRRREKVAGTSSLAMSISN